MSTEPGPSDPEPLAADGPRLLSRGFWIMMAFAALCLAAALFVAFAAARPPLAHGLGDVTEAPSHPLPATPPDAVGRLSSAGRAAHS